MRQSRKKVVTFIGFFLLLSFLVQAQCRVDSVIIPIDDVDVDVYVVALEDIIEYEGTNVSETISGVISASRINLTQFNADEFLMKPYVFGEINISTSWRTVTDWSLYKATVESGSNIIIVNAHGEALPVPSGNSVEEWIDVIADAMINRNVTWVHTAGYPFFYYWLEGSGSKTSLGESGFQRLMSHIGLGNVTCHPPDYETKKIGMDGFAKQNLMTSWTALSDAFSVERGKPLNGSDFKDYITLPIYGTADSYATCAIVNFVKPSERFSSEEWSGFGYYVHIGTDKTFNEQDEQAANVDYIRGYLAGVAAVWTETLDFDCIGVQQIYEYQNPPAPETYTTEIIMTVIPAVCGCFKENTPSSSYMEICITFSLYGLVKTNSGDQISKVRFNAYGQPPDCQLIMLENSSKNGRNDGDSTINIALGMEVGASTLLLLLPIFFPPATSACAAIGGFMLFCSFVDLVCGEVSGIGKPGVNSYDDSIFFEYNPDVSSTTHDGYVFWEFESILYTKIRVDLENRQQWTTVPLSWTIDAWSTLSGIPTTFSGSFSVAIFNEYEPTEYEATIFFEDFEDGATGWSAGDLDSLAGYDYWGISTVDNAHAHCMYCAEIGTNSIYGGNNFDIRTYDKNMNAYLTLPQLDFRPYNDLSLHYDTYYMMENNDYLTIEYYENSIWTATKTIVGTNTNQHREEANIPSSAEAIRFRFYSDNSDVFRPTWGAFIDNVEIRAELPNDANNHTDAGDDFDHASNLLISQTLVNYGAYLNQDPDWYSFYISQSNITEQRRIYVLVNFQCAVNRFKVVLYAPNNPNNPRADPSSSFLDYQLSPTDTYGWWRIKIYAEKGFGPYDFYLSLQPSSSGGGGCPTLFVWNGSVYNDFGVIDIHDPSGEDVIRQIPISSNSVGIHNYKAYFRLREGWEGLNYSHSTIDQVKLYAVINGYSYLCPLIYANHSALGSVLIKLLLSDNYKADAYLLETIDLKFFAPYQNVDQYIFVIEGCNEEKVY